MGGVGSHERQVRGETNDWITPRFIIDALGPFDLDPCASITQPWPTASRSFTVEDDGLSQPWSGRVWCNPPYGPEVGAWMARLALHGRGTALIFARTETVAFQRQVWGKATAVLFLAGRLTFHRPDGTPGKANSGAPSCLVAYGEDDARRLGSSGLIGACVRGWRV